MDENPYKAPGEDEVAKLDAPMQLPLMTTWGRAIAIAEVIGVAVLVVWAIVVLRS